MKKQTKNSVSKMRNYLIRFLEVANSIEDDEWLLVIKASQKDTDRLRRMERSISLGNFRVVVFFLNELLEAVANDEPP